MDWFPIKKLTDIEVAYLAGCIDCDGSISVKVGKIRRSKINICSSHKEYLEKIKEIAGCGHIYRTRKAHKIHGYFHNEGYEWHLSAKKYLLPLVKRLYPYLILKKDKCSKIIKVLNKVKMYSGKKKRIGTYCKEYELQ